MVTAICLGTVQLISPKVTACLLYMMRQTITCKKSVSHTSQKGKKKRKKRNSSHTNKSISMALGYGVRVGHSRSMVCLHAGSQVRLHADSLGSGQNPGLE